MLFKNPMDVIIEAANLDMESTNDIALETALNSRKAEYDSIPVIEDGTISYTEEVVPVFAYKDMAVVELENVVKFMDSQGIEDVEEAVRMIAEHYNIEDLGVVIEGDCKKCDDDDDDGDDDDDDGKKCGKGSKCKEDKEKVMKEAKALIDLKNKAFKLFKKPAKAKKKNCKGKKC